MDEELARAERRFAAQPERALAAPILEGYRRRGLARFLAWLRLAELAPGAAWLRAELDRFWVLRLGGVDAVTESMFALVEAAEARSILWPGGALILKASFAWDRHDSGPWRRILGPEYRPRSRALPAGAARLLTADGQVLRALDLSLRAFSADVTLFEFLLEGEPEDGAALSGLEAVVLQA